ncbi:hypothetical protein KPL71_008147 [Citrus sinensis]|uniref:Uncharacterized protein n=1 Tax=Citrus sinensis TaxID=2711 RepID=A0ACB8M5E1_CITSI|nr:hypothetical protein KPL71_008147 [Citrus sinensis]
MASTSSSDASTSTITPISLSSTLSLPKSCTKQTANKIENLVEYSYIPESAQINESSFPLLSPYQLYKRGNSFTRSIRTLISTKRPHPKEYIQSSRLDQCTLQATTAEQYVTLEIPPELISNWKREGYTHLHLEGVRLILTLHGRKGLPVIARIVMFDNRFKQHQDAVVGTVLTTLHAGSVLLTFYPNFNLSLQDTNLSTALKVQVQIQGAEQISSAKMATLHHQLVYRLQNHALDLRTPDNHSDALMDLEGATQIVPVGMIEAQSDSQKKVVTKPFIPSAITSAGHLEEPKPFESVLKWQTQNARAQNDTLLDADLRAMLSQRYYGPKFDQKEREIRRLKAVLDQIESEKHRPTLFTKSPPIPTISPTYHPFSPMLAPMKPYYPSKLFGIIHRLFKNMPQPPQPKPKPKLQPRPIKIHQPISTTTQQQDSPEHAPGFSQQPSQSKDKEPMHQYASHHIEVSTDSTKTDTSMTEFETESSNSATDSEGAITKLLMAQPEETEPAQPSQLESYFEIPSDIDELAESSTHQPPQPQAQNSYKPSNGPWFTFDDIPTVKWREKLSEMSAWVDLQMIRSGATIESVLKEFVTHFTGSLRDWFDSLGPYRQLQFVQLPNVSSALAILHEQFIREPSAVFEAARRDYLNMKC